MKKAQLDIVWFWRIAITLIIILFIYFVSIDYLSATINSEDLEEQIFLNNLLTSEDCLAYKSKRTYPGIIDIQNFNEERLRKCYDKSDFGYRLTLTDINNNQINKISVLSKDQANFIDICSSIKSHVCTTNKIYVLIKEKGLKQGILKSEVIRNANRV